MPLHLIEGKVPLPFINPCTIAVNRNRTSQESRRAITEMSIELCPTHCFQGQGYKQYIRQNIYLVLTTSFFKLPNLWMNWPRKDSSPDSPQRAPIGCLWSRTLRSSCSNVPLARSSTSKKSVVVKPSFSTAPLVNIWKVHFGCWALLLTFAFSCIK